MFSHIHPDNYDAQLSKKQQDMATLFSVFNLPAPDLYPSAPLNYRQRAEFRVWHDGDDLYYIMFDSKTKAKFRVDDFPVASELINNAMKALLAAIKEAEKLKAQLSTIAPVDIIGRAKKQKIIVDKDYVMESLEVGNKTYIYQQVENSFTQPNAGVNEQMLLWAQQATENSGGDLIELYCGNGNFSIALAENFDRVLGTEISKTSVRSAQINISKNDIDNIDIVRMSSEEFSQAMNGERKFRRLEDFDLTTYNYDTVLVDPPRAGLDRDSVELVRRFNKIIYISCNPETLKENLALLVETHQIDKFALFDQFPYTDHVETGVILTRK